jgi:pimeloyl-ACP methyl ester carboxylesterase
MVRRWLAVALLWLGSCALAAPPAGPAAPARPLLAELREQLDQVGIILPPPRLSTRRPGLSRGPCDTGFGYAPGEIEGATFYCGTFTVPQNWARPDGRNLDLRYQVARATSGQPAHEALLLLAGGPGQSAVTLATEQYQALRRDRDIVLLAQRGTGFGQRLGVEECLVLALGREQDAPQVRHILDAMRSERAARARGQASFAGTPAGARVDQLCWRAFAAQRLDLNQFNTENSARDLVELVKALGYAGFDLHGVSYGSRVAMTIMAEMPRYPDPPTLRAVVLDSPFPPSVYLLSALARSEQDQVLQLLGECEADSVCIQAYPSLRSRLHKLLDRLAIHPLYANDATVSADDLVHTLADLRGSRAAYMPRLIHELERGETATYLALRTHRLGETEPGTPAARQTPADPVPAFMSQAFTVVGAGGQGAVFGFMEDVPPLLAGPDPVTALRGYLNASFSGDTRDKLLALAAPLTPAALAASPAIKQWRAARDAAAERSPDETAALEIMQKRALAQSATAHYLNQNIHCHEDMLFERLEDALNAMHDMEFPQFANEASLRAQAALCSYWPVERASLAIKDPVASSVPALILQGAYDTATPVRMGRRASRELANSRLVVVPQQGHEVWTGADACVDAIATAFVLNPGAPLDLACLEARRPKWSLPDAALGRR